MTLFPRIFIFASLMLSFSKVASAAPAFTAGIQPRDQSSYDAVATFLSKKNNNISVFTQRYSASTQNLGRIPGYDVYSKICAGLKSVLKGASIEYRLAWNGADTSGSQLRRSHLLVCESTIPSFPSVVVNGEFAPDDLIVEPNLRTTIQTLDGGRRDNNCSEQERTISQQLCLAGGYTLAGWEAPNVVSNQEGARIVQVLPDAARKDCAQVQFIIKGKGYDFGEIGCRGGAHLEFTITLFGTASGPLN